MSSRNLLKFLVWASSHRRFLQPRTPLMGKCCGPGHAGVCRFLVSSTDMYPDARATGNPPPWVLLIFSFLSLGSTVIAYITDGGTAIWQRCSDVQRSASARPAAGSTSWTSATLITRTWVRWRPNTVGQVKWNSAKRNRATGPTNGPKACYVRKECTVKKKGGEKRW